MRLLSEGFGLESGGRPTDGAFVENPKDSGLVKASCMRGVFEAGEDADGPSQLNLVPCKQDGRAVLQLVVGFWASETTRPGKSHKNNASKSR